MKKTFADVYKSVPTAKLKEIAETPNLQPLALEAIEAELKSRSGSKEHKKEKSS